MTVTERFLKYVTFETTSDESSDSAVSYTHLTLPTSDLV